MDCTKFFINCRIHTISILNAVPPKPVAAVKRKGTVWDWKAGPSASKKFKSDSKEQKTQRKESTSKKETFTCLECLESYKAKKLGELKFANISRNDKSSIDRHKYCWHQPPANKECTIVPTDSTRVKLIKEQYKESHLIIIKDEIVKDKKESSGSITTPTIVTNAPSKPNQPRRPLQATLIDFVGKKENSDSQVDSIIDAIKELTLEVKDMKKQKYLQHCISRCKEKHHARGVKEM